MRYHIVEDDPWPDDDLSVVPTVDDELGHPIPVTGKSFRRRWRHELVRSVPNAEPAFRVLKKQHCDIRRLTGWLFDLAFARPVRFDVDAVEQAARRLKKAAKEVRRIEFSDFADEVDRERRFRGLSWILAEYADRLARLPRPSPKDPRRHDDELIARIVCHVKEHCPPNRWKDEEVAILLDAAFRWRARDQGLAVRDVQYSTALHTKRRQRLKLSGDSPDTNANRYEQSVTDRRARAAAHLRRTRREAPRRVPTALAAARSLRPELDWRQQPRPRAATTEEASSN